MEEARAGLNQLRIMLGYHTLRRLFPVSSSRGRSTPETRFPVARLYHSRQENVTITGGVPSVLPVGTGRSEGLLTLDAFPGERFEESSCVSHPLDPGHARKSGSAASSEAASLWHVARVSLSWRTPRYAVPLEAVGRLSGSGRASVSSSPEAQSCVKFRRAPRKADWWKF